MSEEVAARNAQLRLDDDSLDVASLSMAALKRELGLQKRPNRLLVKMMNALEQKRQKRGYGWSRGWNKYGMNVFRSHVCDAASDQEYLAPIGPFIESFLGRIEAPYGEFIGALLNDPKLMLFTFYHNNDDNGRQFEGVTLSLGRRVPGDKTKRDRIDIVLEDLRVEGAVDGEVDRVRVYVCPWETYATKDFHLTECFGKDELKDGLAQDLYGHAIAFYDRWKGVESRQWSHWSTRYIDYFGPRNFIPRNSRLA